MWLIIALAVLAVLSIPLVISIRRSTELFVIRVEAGKARFIRGRMPQRLLNEISDVVRRERIQAGEIRCIVESGRPRIFAPGLRDGHVQQLRNVVGTYQIAQIRAGGPPK